MATKSYQPVIWVATSLKDLKAFPRDVQREVGYALYLAKIGGKHPKAKPLRGFRGVLEIVSDYQTDTYRSVYAVKLGDHIYVLHAFQKKSRRGVATPRQEIETIRRRLSLAERIAKEGQNG